MCCSVGDQNMLELQIFASHFRPRECPCRSKVMANELIAARQQLSASLDRYAQVCLSIRNNHHRSSHIAGFPLPEIASELPYLLLLQEKLQEAAQNLTRVHNLKQAKSTLVYPPPVYKLPNEILAQIFRLVVEGQSQELYLTAEHSASPMPRYADFIAQTCSHWREVALECSPLWRHIYLTPHPTRFDSVLDNAKTYAQRANHHALELHITDLEGQDSDLNSAWLLGKFVASIADRVESFEILRHNFNGSEIESKALAAVLKGCSRTFTKLSTHSKVGTNHCFIEPLIPSDGDDDEDVVGAIEVDISGEQIESGLAHLTVLHGCHIHPRWTSAAYQGLVDLRLTSKHDYHYQCSKIDSDEFTTILSASPCLRILHFGYQPPVLWPEYSCSHSCTAP
ncbi:hypothetical protein RSOLAG1IB_10407 [Rhizoctonia solani AG-1 IB]|uniref:F-box domain-containing protein n=1 Tax=Thanatephorus cucumeris (strain AG1-IB / isolate 7/3/14) TaxID=1108050 RepID=A0A0B7FZS0_THACB|nr:hypothetical protein RSOLAG1IB_10407 [Rhizoctonia solani AG-1 IB]